MPKAYWNGSIIADSEETIVFEGRHYFPPGSVHREYLQRSQTRTLRPGEGEAIYYHLTVHGDLNADAAWSFQSPPPRPATSRTTWPSGTGWKSSSGPNKTGMTAGSTVWTKPSSLWCAHPTTDNVGRVPKLPEAVTTPRGVK